MEDKGIPRFSILALFPAALNTSRDFHFRLACNSNEIGTDSVRFQKLQPKLKMCYCQNGLVSIISTSQQRHLNAPSNAVVSLDFLIASPNNLKKSSIRSTENPTLPYIPSLVITTQFAALFLEGNEAKLTLPRTKGVILETSNRGSEAKISCPVDANGSETPKSNCYERKRLVSSVSIEFGKMQYFVQSD